MRCTPALVAAALALSSGCGADSGDAPGDAPGAGPDATAGDAAGPDAPPADAFAALPIPDTCNGSAALCDRRFDEVVYPTTHNAMSSEAEGWLAPNQYLGIERQLEDGVRGLMLDTHLWEGDVLLCHGLCPWGSLPLVDGLGRIRAFLDRHRGEVVTLIFESYVTAEQTAAAFAASGLDRYVVAHAPGTPWPTLRALIAADQRVVVFTDAPRAGGGGYDWYMDVWAHAWETHFSVARPEDFSCAGNRGDRDSPLFILNHFVTDTFAVPEVAPTVNANPFLIDRARQCQRASGHLPNFVTVDFYSVGDLFAAVRELNGLSR
jgi:hypothetical protein